MNLEMKKKYNLSNSGRRKIYGFRGLVDGDIDEERVFRPNDSNQNAAVKNDAGEDNANKKGGK